MEEVIELLEDFVSGKIAPGVFTFKYITLWMEFRDEYYAAEETLGLRETRVKLQTDFSLGLISEEQFDKEMKQLMSKIPNVRIKPDSKEAGIISHIMVEAEAYEPDPQEREKYQIGESELLESVTKAVEELKTIRSTN